MSHPGTVPFPAGSSTLAVTVRAGSGVTATPFRAAKSGLSGRTTSSTLGKRVSRVRVQPETAGGIISDRSYTYDPAGNITAVADTPQVGASDTQCFGYDILRRLTEAWTPKSGVDCATAPTVANLGGPASYWLSWDIDEKTGNRRTEVSHTSGGDTTRTYAYPSGGLSAVRPHALTSVITNAPGQAAVTHAYDYDNTGNTTCRLAGTSGNACTSGTGDQTLTWDVEGHLAEVRANGQRIQTNLYGPDGARLISRDATGTTLYLPGQEVRREGTNTTATRYYTFAGKLIGSRVPGVNGLTWLYTDHQGTQHTSVNAYNQAVTTRRQTPYGTPRGTQFLWPNPKGFVGGDIDPTGLTHLGAREYDPTLGRFISVDPIQDLADPQQWNGYAYANNTPITSSDPTGLRPECGGGTGAFSCGNNVPKAGANSGNWTAPNTVQTVGKPKSAPTTASKIHQFMLGFKAGVDNWAQDAFDGIVSFVHDPLGSVESLTSEANTWQERYAHLDPTPQLGWTCALTGACQIYEDWKAGNYYEAGYGAGGLAIDAALTAVTVGTGLEAAASSRAAGTAGRLAKGPRRPMRLGCKHSFAASTLVLLADGASKAIADLVEGDLVLATDPETDETSAREVTDTHINHDTDLTYLAIQQPGGRSEVLRTTQHHPFWSESRHAWVDAAELLTGELLRAFDSTVASVVEVHSYAGTEIMHDLTVADLHTYYVLAGNTPVLVHNTNGCFGDKWTSQGNLDRHFGDHGAEMGFKAQAEYRYAAEDLMCTCGGRRPGVLMKQDGNTRYYLDPKTGEFGVASNRGIVTYYVPDNPMGHFNIQPGALIP